MRQGQLWLTGQASKELALVVQLVTAPSFVARRLLVQAGLEVGMTVH